MSFNRPPVRKSRSDVRDAAPRLWAEGRQQPRFDLRGYSRVSLLLSRRMARPVLLGTARFFSEGAERMAENTLGPRFARVSRVGRALPSRGAVARGLESAARFMTVAADIAVPPTPAAEPAAPAEPERPLLISSRPRLARARAAAPLLPPVETPPEPVAVTDIDSGLDQRTMSAIRALIDETRDLRPAKPVVPRRPAPALALPPPSGRELLTLAVPLMPPEPRRPTALESLRVRGVHLAATVVAGGVTMMALPVGLVRAVLTHLHGNDLRTWS